MSETGARPAGAWSTVVDLESEEGRAFVQDRLAFLGKVAFILTSTFIVLAHLALWMTAPPGAVVVNRARGGTTALQVGVDLFYGAMWLFCRRGHRTRYALAMLDVGFPALVATTAALPVVLWPGQIPGLEWVMLLAVSHAQVARAVFVPSPPARTVAVGVVAIVPVVVAAWLCQSAAVRGGGPPLLGISTTAWALVSVAAAGVTSDVIYGLRRRVSEARQLGQYTLQEKLGEGGMGVVYRARHAMLRRPTAVKLLPPQKAGEQNLA